MMKVEKRHTKTTEASEFLKPPLLVGIPGLEPGITGPESVVLPITPYPNFLSASLGKVPLFRKCDAKVALFWKLTKGLAFFFCRKNIFLFFEAKSRGKCVPLWAENGKKWIN